MLSNPQATFNLGNVNLLSNPNINPKDGVAYNKNKYTQVAVWALWFLKTSFNQVWIGSPFVPTAGLIMWHWYETFNGSGNFAS